MMLFVSSWVRSLSPSSPDSGEEKRRSWEAGRNLYIALLLPYCRREDCKECWRLSDKGNVISAGDVAAERVRTCNFKSKTHRGTAGQCNDGI